mmetsp:Transcript_14480/g.27085  ORF Transcript_14480/g.27085 Transcript_14480/m.27085 type:complete len:274 (+) Transcript_14480:100-921(+)
MGECWFSKHNPWHRTEHTDSRYSLLTGDMMLAGRPSAVVIALALDPLTLHHLEVFVSPPHQESVPRSAPQIVTQLMRVQPLVVANVPPVVPAEPVRHTGLVHISSSASSALANPTLHHDRPGQIDRPARRNLWSHCCHAVSETFMVHCGEAHISGCTQRQIPRVFEIRSAPAQPRQEPLVLPHDLPPGIGLHVVQGADRSSRARLQGQAAHATAFRATVIRQAAEHCNLGAVGGHVAGAVAQELSTVEAARVAVRVILPLSFNVRLLRQGLAS